MGVWQRNVSTNMTDQELGHIAIELTQSREAREARESQSYLYLLGLIWQADPGNRVDLRLALMSAIEKYDLKRLLNYEYGKDMGRRMVEECSS